MTPARTRVLGPLSLAPTSKPMKALSSACWQVRVRARSGARRAKREGRPAFEGGRWLAVQPPLSMVISRVRVTMILPSRLSV